MGILFLSLIVSFSINAAADKADFKDAYVEFLNGDISFEDLDLRNVNDSNYVFVAGLYNEAVPTYFKENMAALEEMGVKKEQMVVVAQSSVKKVEQNAATLLPKLKKIVEKNRKPLVVIAHSKGAAETLVMALNNPKFIQKNVSHVFLVQGAIGGSGIADYIEGEGPKVDWRMGPVKAYAFYWMMEGARHANSWIAENFGATTRLTTKMMSALWEKLLNNGKDHSRIQRKIHYIVSHQSGRKVTETFRPLSWYVSAYYGKNDGLLSVKQQQLEGVGTVLAEVDADHSDLFFSKRYTNSPKKQREALMAGIVNFISK